ncbi:MAG: pullulanase [Chlorobiaceae bacterium]|nr:pullulanase [Chlorobiaceae bacterium]MBA4310197.1 pullulanase [Chlorobiaceae bacterium]
MNHSKNKSTNNFTLQFSLIFFLFITIILSNNILGATLFITDLKKENSSRILSVQEKHAKLDKYFSSKKLGGFIENGKTFFRLFAPQANQVYLVTFDHVEQLQGNEILMSRDEDGVWEIFLDGEKEGLFYGFKVLHEGDSDRSDNVLCLDPYAKAVASLNTYFTPRKGIIVREGNFDWEGTDWVKLDWRDLVIYEMHIKDQTAHPTAGAKSPGTYKGLIEKGITGGIDYIKSLGVNAVEFLPAQEFANIEIPYRDSLKGRFNTWNPYERNHWGYMTAAFFAPESYYVDSYKGLEWNKWKGQSKKQINDFKEMVKGFHKEGIAVIMDVVYNHISEYELGNLKEIDREYYFRLDEQGNYIANSGCGNDIRTESPMMRRMIVESVLYWMTEYKVDGFRFDLGKLIDWETLETIIYEARKINPHVIFVAEPWGGGYDPKGFSLRGWGSWNDQIRNGVKGENPKTGHGWLFGKWYGNNNPDRIKSYVNGTLIRDEHGLFQKKEHSVNYLESHDGYTLGDFIRIGLGINPDSVITDVDKFQKLTPLQLKLNKLGALFLFTSQGIIMIHSGQEYARTKVIDAATTAPDKRIGMLDHNSYEKDNNTNFIDYNHAKANSELLNYYQGLIALRNKYDSFRRAEYEEVSFFDISNNEFAIGFQIKHKDENFVVVMNANKEKSQKFDLPAGNWEILVNDKTAGVKSLGKISKKINVAPSTGYILKKAK